MTKSSRPRPPVKRSENVKCKTRSQGRARSPQIFLSAGQAARRLRLPLYQVRELCRTGQLAAQATTGGHLRISRKEIQRYQEEQAVAQPLPGTLGGEAAVPIRRLHPRLLDNPTQETIAAADRAVLAENQTAMLKSQEEAHEILEKRRARLEEKQEQQRARLVEQQEEQRAAAQKAAERRQADKRRQWEEYWLNCGLDLVPEDAPPEYADQIHDVLQQRIGELEEGRPDEAMTFIVRTCVEKALSPWMTKKRIEKEIQAARNLLPWNARGVGNALSECETELVNQAVAACDNLPDDASDQGIRAALLPIANRIVTNWKHAQAVRIANESVSFSVEMSQADAARKAVRDALAALPVGSGEASISEAKQSALAPFIAQRNLEQRADRLLIQVDRYIALIGKSGSIAQICRQITFSAKIREQIRPRFIRYLSINPADDATARAHIDRLVDGRLDEIENDQGDGA